MTHFNLIGGGRRAEFFLRIAQALPGWFRVTGVLVRDAARREAFARRCGSAVAGSLDELGRLGPADFTVLAVDRAAAPGWLAGLSARKIAVLAETPPAADVAGLRGGHALVAAGARIQVAEQYHAQPWHAARLALAASGRLGLIRHAQVSVAHGYHGVSLIRRLLGAGLAPAKIRAIRSELPSTAPQAAGPATHTLATLDFGGRTALFDFCTDQYCSPLRRPRVLVRGDRGEIATEQARWLDEAGNPAEVELRRISTGTDGNPGGYCLQGITAAGEWLYRNPFGDAPLADDELAGAAALAGMASFARGGPDFYSFAEAAQDQYLALLIDEAAATGREIVSEVQPWSTYTGSCNWASVSIPTPVADVEIGDHLLVRPRSEGNQRSTA